jgi:hypothetical protein
LLTLYHSRKDGENNEKKRANTSYCIHPIGSLDGVKFDIAGINRITPIGADINQYPDGETHMTQAFRNAKRLIADNLSTYKTSHPPFVFHITDGANVDKGDLATEFSELTNLTTDYGKTLVTTAYIADNLIEQNTSTNWQGLTTNTYLPMNVQLRPLHYAVLVHVYRENILMRYTKNNIQTSNKMPIFFFQEPTTTCYNLL